MEDIKNTTFNEEMSERVDRFLRKEMSEAESLAFMEEVKTSPELREYYQRQFNLMRGIKIHEMRALMRAKEEELATNRSNFRNCLATFSTGYKYVMVSVVAATLVLGFFIWDRNVTQSVGQQMYFNMMSSDIMRGTNAIDALVQDGEYKKALDLIDEELGTTYELEDDSEALFVYTQEMNDLKYRKALIFLKMGKKRAAKAILKELNDVRSEEVLDQLLW